MSKSVNRELTEGELDEVTGGLWTAALVSALNRAAGRADERGQNDPAQMFQQIMQQMTQG